jgi:hypothetical protein
MVKFSFAPRSILERLLHAAGNLPNHRASVCQPMDRVHAATVFYWNYSLLELFVNPEVQISWNYLHPDLNDAKAKFAFYSLNRQIFRNKSVSKELLLDSDHYYKPSCRVW